MFQKCAFLTCHAFSNQLYFSKVVVFDGTVQKLF